MFSLGAAQVPKVSRRDKSICDGRHRQTHSFGPPAVAGRRCVFEPGVSLCRRRGCHAATEAGSCELARPRRRLGISTMVGPSPRRRGANPKPQAALRTLKKSATIQLKGRLSVKTPSGKLLSGCCQIGGGTALGRRKGSKSREVLIPAVIATRRFCQPRHCAGVGACVPVRSAAQATFRFRARSLRLRQCGVMPARSQGQDLLAVIANAALASSVDLTSNFCFRAQFGLCAPNAHAPKRLQPTGRQVSRRAPHSSG